MIYTEFYFMSRHISLKKSTKILKKRNVLKRFERIDILKKQNLWDKDTCKAIGLPKVCVEKI